MGVRFVPAIPVVLAALLLLPAPAGAQGTGGAAYDPSPGTRETQQGTPGMELPAAAAPGSGGASFDPELGQAGTQPRPKRRLRRPRRRIAQPGTNLHVFPVAGAYTLGGKDARFGAPRAGHRHQGHDITAAEGTPVVAPRGGTITWRAYQARGAGYYLVLDPVVEPFNYVFMHLQRGSVLVKLGDRVRTGQTLANVGSTGSSSTPHLHFEIWNGPWQDGGVPIDPLPVLRAWEQAPRAVAQ